MRYYIDEEFIEDGRTIDIVSIGIVAGDGRKLYLQSVEFDPHKASPWVAANVFPHLSRCSHPYGGQILADELELHKRELCIDYRCPWNLCRNMQTQIKIFLDPAQYGTPELWGWCCSYDHVALCQLFGPMTNIPNGWPYYINDLQSILGDTPDSELPPQEGTAHHALEDALHIKRLCEIYAGHNNNV